MNAIRNLLMAVLACLLLVSCGGASTADEPPVPTATPPPTEPPAPSATPPPTETPLVLATSTRPPQPNRPPTATPDYWQELYDVGDYRLYLHCEGEGSPVVIFDTDYSSTYNNNFDWESSYRNLITPLVAPYTRVCIYDRAGLGRSENFKVPLRTGLDLVQDLHTLLQAAEVPPPYIYFARLMADYNALIFAQEYPDELAAILADNPVHPDEKERSLAALASPAIDVPDQEKIITDYFNSASYLTREGLDLDATIAQAKALGSLGDIPMIVLYPDYWDSNEFFHQTIIDALYPMDIELAEGLADLSNNGVVSTVKHPQVYYPADVLQDILDLVVESRQPGAARLNLVWSLPGESVGLGRLQGVAVNTKGTMAMIDYTNKQVRLFDPQGQPLAAIGKAGAQDGQFKFKLIDHEDRVAAASGLAFDSQDNLYVVDPLNFRIQKFSPDGQFLLKWGVRGEEDGQFRTPTGLALDPQGNVYVSDFDRHLIQKFSPDGQFLLKWGAKGSADGEFERPTALASDSQGNIYVLDYLNRRIQKFDSQGQWLSTIRDVGYLQGKLVNPVALAVDAQDRIYVLDAGVARLVQFDPQGQYLGNWRYALNWRDEPLGLAIDANGFVFITDHKANTLVKVQLP